MGTSTAVRLTLAVGVIAIGVVQHFQAKKAHKQFCKAFNETMAANAENVRSNAARAEEDRRQAAEAANTYHNAQF